MWKVDLDIRCWLLAALACSSLVGCAAVGQSEMVHAGVAYPADPASLIERIAAGNLNQPGSQAYNRWGAGYVHGLAASDRKLEWQAIGTP